eukprot:760327-Hanusia_phi.AAC.2
MGVQYKCSQQGNIAEENEKTMGSYVAPCIVSEVSCQNRHGRPTRHLQASFAQPFLSSTCCQQEEEDLRSWT